MKLTGNYVHLLAIQINTCLIFNIKRKTYYKWVVKKLVKHKGNCNNICQTT